MISFKISFLTFLILLVSGADGSKIEKKLLKDLLDSYEILERPVEKDSDNLEVKVGVTLMRIINVDAVTKHVDLNAWISYSWNDYNLRWNPSDYENITSLRLPPHRIWTPDMHAYNQVGNSMDPTHPTKVVVKNDGNMSFIPPGVFQTSCALSLEDYPLDEHNCTIKIGSWTHSGDLMDVVLDGDEGDLSSMTKSTQWDVLGFKAQRSEIYYACCPEPYVDVTFTLNIKRKGSTTLSEATSLNFIVCAMMVLSLLLPPSSGHKITLGLFGLFLSAYANVYFNPMPGHEQTPRLAQYFDALMTVNFLVLLTNVIIFYIYHRTGETPYLLRKINEKILPPMDFVCPKRKNLRYALETEMSDASKSRHGRESIDNSGIGNSDIQDLISQVDNLRDVIVQQDLDGVMNDWKYLAVVLDRMLFVIWIFIIFVFSLAVFPSFE